MMERLTEIIEKYIEAYQLPPFGREVDGTVELLQEVSNKLAEYENAEEQGLLLRLPCKVGDTVFKLKQYNFCPVDIFCRKDISCSECRANTLFGIVERKFKLNELKEIGKTVFLTREEAEQKLNEMESK